MAALAAAWGTRHSDSARHHGLPSKRRAGDDVGASNPASIAYDGPATVVRPSLETAAAERLRGWAFTSQLHPERARFCFFGNCFSGPSAQTRGVQSRP